MHLSSEDIRERITCLERRSLLCLLWTVGERFDLAKEKHGVVGCDGGYESDDDDCVVDVIVG